MSYNQRYSMHQQPQHGSPPPCHGRRPHKRAFLRLSLRRRAPRPASASRSVVECHPCDEVPVRGRRRRCRERVVRDGECHRPGRHHACLRRAELLRPVYRAREEQLGGALHAAVRLPPPAQPRRAGCVRRPRRCHLAYGVHQQRPLLLRQARLARARERAREARPLLHDCALERLEVCPQLAPDGRHAEVARLVQRVASAVREVAHHVS
mmetsp:Transcript_2961/g.10471  ORF Transcript_2961/g.10471 Transcript_2961/m.10471 type:complete len:209 (+) Transcript_2961:505-1131(+)